MHDKKFIAFFCATHVDLWSGDSEKHQSENRTTRLPLSETTKPKSSTYATHVDQPAGDNSKTTS